MAVLLFILALGVAFWLLSVLERRLKRRGLIGWKLRFPRTRSMGSALVELSAISRPTMHHVQQAMEGREARREQRGAADVPGDEEFFR